MRTYKDYKKWNIGSSDIASLLLLGCNENGDIKAKHISVYRAGEFGCVIQVTEPIMKNFWFIEEG